MKSIPSGLVAAGIALLGASPALAQSADLGVAARAPEGAVEISVAPGFTQGFGAIEGGAGVGDVAQGGFGLGLGLGYRLAPYWAIALTGQYQELDAGGGWNARGMTAGAGVTYHGRPYSTVSTWVELAAGYRLLWSVPHAGPTTLWHGFQIGRLLAGVDLRTTPEMAFGPMIGADINAFVWRAREGDPAARIAGVGVSTFFYIGAQGRFDIGARTPAGASLAGR